MLTATPLYRQIAERLTERVYGGLWTSGEPIPTEPALAEEFAVSQGTVRKALARLEVAGLIVRQQGRGTFVSDLGSERSWFHVFRLAQPGGERAVPELGTERVRRCPASSASRTTPAGT